MADKGDLKELEGSLAGDVLALMDKVRPERWSIRFDDNWCYLAPPGHLRRNQGWKLHVSATPLSVTAMLGRVIPVLLDYRCAFKFARTLGWVEQLTSGWWERESGGKILTAYPDHDGQVSGLAKELHSATEGLPGPPVLSDRAYNPDSIVSFRFGGFSAARVLGDNGRYEPMLVTPDGRWVPDEVFPWFSPPKWATCPVEEDGPQGGTPSALHSPARLLGGRYRVHKAIRHSYRGGVYHGTDVPTGEPVIIKHARPHVGVDRVGRDCRDGLHWEADMLARLAPTGLVPRKRDLLEQSGQVFLVEDEIHGQALRRWVEERVRGSMDGPSVGEVSVLAQALMRLVMAVHGMGLGIRDLNPTNAMVNAEGDRIWLVDVEGLSVTGEPTRRYLTAGYAAPEQYQAPAYAPAPPLTADLYSLGATLLHLCTGIDPALPEDDPPARQAGQRLSALVDVAATQSTGVATFAPLIHGFINDDPDQRWSLRDGDRFLQSLAAGTLARTATAVSPVVPGRESVAMPRHLFEDTLGYLRVTMTTDQPYLWPPARRDLDPCSVAAGAAGILAALTSAAVSRADPELRSLVSATAHWLEQRLPDEPRTLPGLQYGRAGTAWALHDAGRYLGNEDMAARAVALLAGAPVRWHRPCIAHGLAGTGLATVHLWRSTGDPELSARIQAYAQGIFEAAEHIDTGVAWPTCQQGRTRMSPAGCYGFADGIAGIGAFLLAVGQAVDDHKAIQMAQACGQTLCSTTVTMGGAAFWPTSKNHHDVPTGFLGSDSPGAGSFLIRLWSHTGDRQFLDAAELAATAVYRERWAYQPAVLADCGEFLLDMAAATGDDRYRAQAADLAICIAFRSALRHGRLAPVDVLLQHPIHVGSHAGLAGVLAFLHRLHHGGRRLWMIDPPDGDHQQVPSAGTPDNRKGGELHAGSGRS